MVPPCHIHNSFGWRYNFVCWHRFDFQIPLFWKTQNGGVLHYNSLWKLYIPLSICYLHEYDCKHLASALLKVVWLHEQYKRSWWGCTKKCHLAFFTFSSYDLEGIATSRPNNLDPHKLDLVHTRPIHARPIQARPSKLDPIFPDYEFFSKPVYTKLKAFPSLVNFIFFFAHPISFCWQMSDLWWWVLLTLTN